MVSSWLVQRRSPSPLGNEGSSVSDRSSRDPARRRRNAASINGETTRVVEITGSVPELDQANRTLQILAINGDIIKAHIATEHIDSALKAFNGFRRGVRACFRGTGRLDPAGRVLEIASLSLLNIVEDPLDISLQLADIRTLEDGWLDGDGSAPSQSGVDWIESRLNRYLPADFPRPYLYPTAYGGIQVEWSIKSNDVSLEIDLDSHLGIWHQLNLKPQLNLQSDDEIERELNLDHSSAWEWIICQINCMGRI